jgi:hypothetical protein
VGDNDGHTIGQITVERAIETELEGAVCGKPCDLESQLYEIKRVVV